MEHTASCPLPASLLTLLATVPDPRRAQGRRFPLVAVLALALTAILANHRSELAIAEWGAGQSPEVLRALSFANGKTPHQSTIQRLFRALAPAPLTAALAAFVTPADADAVPRSSRGVAIDGKALRGMAPFAPPTAPPVHLLTAFCHHPGSVLAQQPLVAAGDKAAELNAASTLLAQAAWHGRVLTGDALYCQRGLCQQVVDAGGEYLVIVKNNQPALHQAIATLFAHCVDRAVHAASLPPQDLRTTVTWDKGHGRVEHAPFASTALQGYLDWPAHTQVFMVERTWHQGESAYSCVRYGITRLSPTSGSPARLLALVRGHWGIENGLNYVKDVTLGEDASTVHRGAGPWVLAMVRDTVVGLLHRAGYRTIAARLRYHSTHPQAALALLGLLPPENA